MKTTQIKNVIFVYGNPLQKVRDLAGAYNLTVIGTNDPTMLQNELQNANDASMYFFLITNEEELKYLNDILTKVTFSTEESNWFVLISKKLDKRLNTFNNSIFVSTYEEPLTEKTIDEYVLQSTVYGQRQYILRKDQGTVKKITPDKMRLLSRSLQHNFDNESLLQGIRGQFNDIAQNQRNTPVSEILKTNNEMKLESQEYLINEIQELEIRLKTAHDEEDVKQILSIIMELYEMMSTDLKDSSKVMIDSLIKESLKKSKEYELSSQSLKDDFDNAVRLKDKNQIDAMIKIREEKVTEVKAMEREVMRNATQLKEGLTKSFIALGEMSKKTVRDYNEYVNPSQKQALQVAFNSSSSEVTLESKRMVDGIEIVLDDLQRVVMHYSSIVDFDTTLIETQQNHIKTLETQNIVEEVVYENEFMAKLRVLVSPTPNLGASTMLRMFKNQYEKILMLDFREVTSDTKGFKNIKYSDLFSLSLEELENQSIKVHSSLAKEVEAEHLEKRLFRIEELFDAIYIVVDRFFQTGISPELIKRILYLSNIKDSNLIIINQTRSFFEEMTSEDRKVTFILNLATDAVYDILNDRLTVAGINPSEVRINVLPLRNELMGGINEEGELKTLHSQFKY